MSATSSYPPKGIEMNPKQHYLYSRWRFMRNAVLNPRSPDYPNQGGRGVRIDPDFDKFWNYVKIVETHRGPPPTPDHKLARVDQNADWTISNMAWSTSRDVAERCPAYPSISYGTNTTNIRGWSRITGINPHTIHGRYLRGWPIERILTTPAQTKIRKDLETH